MPWKLIGFLIILVLVALFTSLNLTNRADINLGFHVFKSVPIFLSLFFAFLVGALIMIPFTIGPSARKKKKRKEKKKKKELAEESKEPVEELKTQAQEIENVTETRP